MGKRKIVSNIVVAKKKKEELVEDEEEKEATYDDLPTEIKMEIINMLGAAGRSNMSRVSKLSEALCKMSPYFLQSLKFIIIGKKPRIIVSHSREGRDYVLLFGENEIICEKRGIELWRETLATTKSEIQQACEHFAKMLQQYHKTIRAAIEGILEIDQIYETRGKLYIKDFYLKYEQLIKLKASYCEFKIGKMTEENIANWLELYRNGEWHHTVRNYIMEVDNKTFDCHKLWRLLGSRERDLYKYLAIRTRADRKKMLHLKFSSRFLVLRNITAEFFGNNR
ncbi:unnamed protein product [Caenorhabditis angaria]|uniref:F-box domain-containing protein n=1 Tax=Caenorhabditis angaria TaxID=860376 RepID=A0A9P1NBD5_9PELO|nr:unnamed protein product [Caenorhabditis angaria]